MKPRSNISPVPLQPLQTVHMFERCQWDHVGPIKCEDKKDAHILVMTECPTSYTITAVVADTSAETTARTSFDKLVCTFGCPAVIQGDNNAAFMKEFFKILEIKQISSSAYSSRTQVIVERRIM